jgi:predicted Zn-dependent protease
MSLYFKWDKGIMNLKQLLGNIRSEAEWVGLREVKEATTYHIVRDGKPQANHTGNTHGIMVEVLYNGQFGYYGTQNLTLEGIQNAVDNALKQAKLASKYSIYSFDQSVRPVAIGEYQSPFKLARNTMSVGDINQFLIKANEALKISDKIVSVSANSIFVETDFHYVCTNGSDAHQSFLMSDVYFSATAQDGSVTQTRSNGGRGGLQAGLEILDETQLLQDCQTASEQAIELLSAEECPTETTSLVLAPDQMMLQIHESIGHALEIDRILGDERNYAGYSFVRPKDFGTLQYGSKLLNVTFDPTVPNELASYAFDDGGLKAQKEYIIKDGLLVRGLGGMESQTRSGLKGVANFRASNWNRAPIDRMANLNVEPGESSFENIISNTERGVFMETNRSWSIDDYRNKFQFGAEYGKLIENGKLTKTVKNPNYRGISNPFWNSLSMVGNRDTFSVHGTPNCGKGEPNQVIRVGHASPVCRFDNIEIFGGA